MAVEQLRTFLRRLRCLPKEGGASDGQLLERFASHRDEAAFEVLVWRHGGLVLGVCARVLRHAEDAEDAFQATFLMLARKAGCINQGEALASWLYKVAYRVALRLRSGVARRVALPLGPTLTERGQDGETGDDFRPVLDKEINDLPEKYRAAVVLCYLEGKTMKEAARQLGCARGTICSRLAWARQRLRSRLTRRGLALSAVLAPVVVPGTVVGATIKTAVAFASRQTAAAALVGQAAGLAQRRQPGGEHAARLGHLRRGHRRGPARGAQDHRVQPCRSQGAETGRLAKGHQGPATAVVEEGRHSFLFVQPDAGKFVYEQRRVGVVRRGKDVVHVRSRLAPGQRRQGFQIVRPGERIVTAGAVGLRALLADLKDGEER